VIQNHRYRDKPQLIPFFIPVPLLHPFAWKGLPACVAARYTYSAQMLLPSGFATYQHIGLSLRPKFNF
jgi:hypothetical protein